MGSPRGPHKVRVPGWPYPAPHRPPSSQQRREAIIATGTPAPNRDRQRRAKAIAKELYTSRRRRLLAIARRNCADIEEAEEALQDAFVLFITHFDPSGSAPPLAWLTLTLKRECWARQKRKQRGRPGGAGSPGEARTETIADPHRLPDEQILVRESIAANKNQLAQLKPDERQALWLLGLGYSYREIGEMTDWTYTKVNRCITEGRARLRKLKRLVERTEPP